jgi:hypothetical protein
MRHIDGGAFGEIYESRDKASKQPVVIKIMNKNLLLNFSHVDHVIKEIACNM